MPGQCRNAPVPSEGFETKASWLPNQNPVNQNHGLFFHWKRLTNHLTQCERIQREGKSTVISVSGAE